MSLLLARTTSWQLTQFILLLHFYFRLQRSNMASKDHPSSTSKHQISQEEEKLHWLLRINDELFTQELSKAVSYFHFRLSFKPFPPVLTLSVNISNRFPFILHNLQAFYLSLCAFFYSNLVKLGTSENHQLLTTMFSTSSNTLFISSARRQGSLLNILIQQLSEEPKFMEKYFENYIQTLSSL